MGSAHVADNRTPEGTPVGKAVFNIAVADLNLLVVFEALMLDRSVSRAAKRVGLAQSSMSNALARLRHLFDDELFVRTPRAMIPTERALSAYEPLSQALETIRSVFFAQIPFDPNAHPRTFRIGASDHADFTLVPPLTRRLQKGAAEIRVVVRAVDHQAAIELLDGGQLDLVTAAFSVVPKRIRTVPLYSERFVCIARRDHPRLRVGHFTCDMLAQLPHLVVSPGGYPDRIDRALADHKLRRRRTMTLPSHAALPYALQSSDCIAVVSSRIARHLVEKFAIEQHDLPVHVEPWTFNLYWCAHSEKDAAIAWLRGELVDIARGV